MNWCGTLQKTSLWSQFTRKKMLKSIYFHYVWQTFQAFLKNELLLLFSPKLATWTAWQISIYKRPLSYHVLSKTLDNSSVCWFQYCRREQQVLQREHQSRPTRSQCGFWFSHSLWVMLQIYIHYSLYSGYWFLFLFAGMILTILGCMVMLEWLVWLLTVLKTWKHCLMTSLLKRCQFPWPWMGLLFQSWLCLLWLEKNRFIIYSLKYLMYCYSIVL